MNKKIIGLLLLLLTIFFLASISYNYRNSHKGTLSASKKRLSKVNKERLSDAYITSPFVVREDNNYKMWFMSKYAGSKGYISSANSKDGIAWNVNSKTALTASKVGWDSVHVGSPSIIIKGKKFLMWYRGDSTNLQQIGLAISEDGIAWKRYLSNPVLRVRNNKWDSKSLVAPHVLYEQGLYKIYYRGSQYLDQDLSGIGYAESKDGIKWSRRSEPIIARGTKGEWDDKQVGDPSVLYNKSLNLYQMWYSGESFATNTKLNRGLKSNHSGNGKMIGYATSKDGVSWKKYNHNPVLKLGKKGEWDWAKVDNPFVVLDKRIYKMWYRGNNAKFDSIGYATSSDGINWQKYEANPVIKP